VPENSKFEYDEIISSEKIQVNRWLVGFYDNPVSKAAETEFAENIKEFIAELKKNPQTEGFIIRNSKTRSRNIKEALQQIQKEKIDKGRFQIFKKRIYESHYPEFMTVTIKQ
jgi:hypothetical protein